MTGIGGVSRVETDLDYRPERKVFSQGATEATAAASPVGPSQMVGPGAKEDKAKFDISSLKDEDKKKLEEELKKMNDSLVSSGKLLKFKYNEEAKTTYVEVIDSESQKVLASLPPEFLIELSVRMKELIGMFIDKRL